MKGQKYTIKNQLEWIQEELQPFYPSREIDAFSFLIFRHILNLSRLDLHNKLNIILSLKIIKKTKRIISALKKFKPIQYILGETIFYDLPIKVNRNVLIPRPETEELVDWIIKENLFHEPGILDIGTGSGCIAIALARNIKNSKVTGIDAFIKVLKIANRNAKLNRVKVIYKKANILKPESLKFSEKFDIIISNPPYILNSELKSLPENVAGYEPHTALFVDDTTPFLFYEKIADLSLYTLNPGGFLYFEINEKFGAEISEILKEKGFTDLILRKDINGKDRMIRCKKS
jgi:release factor glutamine methyltransferase